MLTRSAVLIALTALGGAVWAAPRVSPDTELAVRFIEQARTGEFAQDTVDFDMSESVVRLQAFQRVASIQPDQRDAAWHRLVVHPLKERARLRDELQQQYGAQRHVVVERRAPSTPLLAESAMLSGCAVSSQVGHPFHSLLDGVAGLGGGEELSSRIQAALLDAATVTVACPDQSLDLIIAATPLGRRVVHVL